MKRFLAVILSALMLSSACFGADPDYASMSDAELNAVIDAAKAELAKREELAAESKTELVLADVRGMKLVLTGKAKIDEYDYLVLKGTLYNNSDETLSFGMSDAYINGWSTNPTLSPNSLAPGTKAKCKIRMYCEGIVKKVKKIDDVVVSMSVFGEDYNAVPFATMKLIFSKGKITSIEQQ